MPNRLGLKDWKVTNVEESTTDMRVTAEYTPPPTACPRCGLADQPLYKHDVRTQEFMDTPLHGKRVHLIVRRQRYVCQGCEKTFQQILPDMEEDRTMTKRLVSYIKRLSLEKKFTEIADEVGVNEKTVRNLFKEHVERLDSERVITAPEWLGVDELHILGDFRAMLTAPGEKKILDLLEKRDKATVLKWMLALPNRKNVKVVTMDMHRPYREAALAAFPNAACVVDVFHVVRMANKAADSLRIALKDELDPKVRRKIKRDRWIIQARRRNLKAGDVIMLHSWDRVVPMLSAAYRAKEDFYDIYEKAKDRAEALELWDLWLEMLEPELKKPFSELIRAVTNWKPEIFNFFDYRGKTNAYTEAINSVIRAINRAGRGYSLDAIRAKVLYGGKKRQTDTEYQKVALSMKIKRPKVDTTYRVDPETVLHVDKPPKPKKKTRKYEK
jgi:transposase